MNDDREGSMSHEGSWYSHPEGLLEDVRETSGHWGQLPEIPGYDQVVEVQRGGQGVVYRARHESTDRRVAIKVMHDGACASESSRVRFQRETEFAARVAHPNIVPIHDSGVTADGRLYYVMEYVHGKRLDESDLGHKRDIRETLLQFVDICDAVHYAHQRGVIHRDLKPGNILVDEKGGPHILDFGLAKFTSESLPKREAHCSISETGVFLGSLAWASPEQCEGSPDGIDIRTDVYSLGVILYQLIVGRLPHVISPNLRQTLNEISSTPPPRPRSIRPDVPEDVETIVLRSLAKEPERRYQTAGDLAKDIRRFLSGEPIEARREGNWQVLRRSLARHKLIAQASVALTIMAVVFSVAMVVVYRRAVTAEESARANLTIAQTQTAKADAVREFLEQMLSSADPSVSADHSLTVRDMLDRAALELENGDIASLEVEAEIRSVIGESYYGLGLWDEAEEQQRVALKLHRELYGEEHVEVAACLHSLGGTLLAQREYSEAEELLLLALEISGSQSDVDGVQVALCLKSLADLRHGQLRFDEANEYYERAYEVFKADAGAEDDQTIITLVQWTDLLVNTQEYGLAGEKIDLALQSIRRRSLGRDPLLSGVLQGAGLVKMYLREYEAAVEALEEAASSQRAIFGESHPRLTEIYNLMGDVRRNQGLFAQAEACHLKALAVCEELVGRESPEGARSLWGMGQARWTSGDFNGAESMLREAIEIRRGVYEPDHHLVVMSVFQLGKMEVEAQRHERAAPLLEEAVESCGLVFGDEHALTISATASYGVCLAHLERYVEGEGLLLTAYAKIEESQEANDPRRKQLLGALVEFYTLWNRPNVAAEYQARLSEVSAGGS